ncbi:transposase [Oxalobacteraceae bacterium GrIS 1.11]
MPLTIELIKPLERAEWETLTEMSRHHRFAAFRLRARGLLSLNDGIAPSLIAQVLGKSVQSIYNWARWWKKDGLVGILDGNKGGRPFKLTTVLLDTAEKIAREESLTLASIKRRVLELHPEALEFSEYRLSYGLRKRGLIFKRSRLTLGN